MVAAFGSNPIPTVLLNQLHEVSYFHYSTIIPLRQTVNTPPRLTPELTGREELGQAFNLADDIQAISAPVE
jgi:hypothetical protein